MKTKIELCIECKEKPVYVKKRKLCNLCYGRLYKQGSLLDSTHNYCKVIAKQIQHKSEIEFIKNYFPTNKFDWLHEPIIFNCNGIKYTPDFYDIDKNVFIEVSGTRQAYHKNKEKYEAFRKYFPLLNFEIRKPDGTILDERPNIMNKWD